MAKNSIKQIEQDEKKILNELAKNANKSINDIAKSCHFSRQKVWRIIKNLEKNNTIWGYVAVLDQNKVDKKRYIMLMKRTNKPVQNATIDHILNREIAEKVKKFGVEFINSIYINGRYDWLISFTASNIKDAKNVVELYYQLYPELISEIDLHEYMFTVQYDGISNPEIKKLKDFFKI